MVRNTLWSARTAMLAALGLSAFVVGCKDKEFTQLNVVVPPTNNAFVQTNLVADAAGTGAVTIDPNLINPWGIAFGASGALWVSNNGTGTATVYNANGTALGITVSIPGAGSPVVPATGTATRGVPTGVIFNTTANSFQIPGSGSAAFIFAGEDGTIAAWNTTTGSSAALVVDQSADTTVYKGITMAVGANNANQLYLTDFHHNKIDVYDSTFTRILSFTDSTLPSGYAPFGITTIGNQIWVAFAKQQGPDNLDDTAAVGNGFVDVFNANGSLARRLASNGNLNSPWGIVQAPANFGPFGGAILVGNFGDGLISAYDAASGGFIDFLRDVNGNAISIPGLWGLQFGPVAGSTSLFFASGPGNEAHGLVGTLTPR